MRVESLAVLGENAWVLVWGEYVGISGTVQRRLQVAKCRMTRGGNV
jgi:hypothetical protein